MVKYTGRGLVVKRPGVLSKVQMLKLVLGVASSKLLLAKGGLGGGHRGLPAGVPGLSCALLFRSLGATPISRKTLSERKGHSRSSRRVPGYSRSSSQSSKFHSQKTKFHSRNGIPRLEQCENHNSKSNSRSDSRN